MSHDKIRAAARKRMAQTGEPYATARREVIKNYQEAGAGSGAAASSSAGWFAIDYSDMGRVSLWDGHPAGWGPRPRRRGAQLDRGAGSGARLPPGHPAGIGAVGHPLCAPDPVQSGYTAAEGAGW